MSTTDIEKKSLEAHVELCAERYNSLETKLINLESRMDKFESYLLEIRNSIVNSNNAKAGGDSSGPYKVMIAVGTTLVGALIGGLFTLLVHVK